MTSFWSDDVIDALADAAPDSWQRLAAAYRAGVGDGYTEGFRRGHQVAEASMAAAWSRARDLVLPVLAQPTHAEAEVLRYGVRRRTFGRVGAA